MTRFTPQSDLRAYRGALGAFATGVTIVTTQTASGPVGMTANSFASVSLDPPLILWSPAKSSSRFAAFSQAPQFIVHVLGVDQRPLAEAFTRAKNAFDGLDWSLTDTGSPLIRGCLASFECQTDALHDAGDHVIILGRVQHVAHQPGAPLLFHGGQFGTAAG